MALKLSARHTKGGHTIQQGNELTLTFIYSINANICSKARGTFCIFSKQLLIAFLQLLLKKKAKRKQAKTRKNFCYCELRMLVGAKSNLMFLGDLAIK